MAVERGKYDAEEKARICAAVNLSGLPQLVWDIGFEKAAADDDVRHAGGAQNDHDPGIVVQTQVFYGHEHRDQTTGEKHRERKHQRKKLAAHKILAGKRIRRG